MEEPEFNTNDDAIDPKNSTSNKVSDTKKYNFKRVTTHDKKILSLVVSDVSLLSDSIKISENMLIIKPELLPDGVINVNFDKYKSHFESEAYESLSKIIESKQKMLEMSRKNRVCKNI